GIEQIEMRRRAGLKQINHPLGLGGVVQRLERTFGFGTAQHFRAEQIRVEQRGERKRADAGSTAPEKRPAAEGLLDFGLKKHGGYVVVNIIKKPTNERE